MYVSLNHLSVFLILAVVGSSCRTVQRSHMSQSGDRLEIMTASDHRSSLDQPADSTMSAWKDNYLEQTEKNPKDANAWGKLAKIAVAEKDLKSARTYATKAISFDIEQVDAKIAFVQINIVEDNLAKAKVMLASLTAKLGTTPELLHLSGLILKKENKSSAAASAWEQALALDPTLMATRMNLGILQLRYYQYRSAAGHFQRIIEAMPANQDAKLHLAIAKAGYGDSSGAEALYQEVGSDQSNNPIYLFNYGVFLKQKGQWEESLELIEDYLAQTKASKDIQRERAMQLAEETKDLIEAKKAQDMKTKDLSKMAENAEKPQTKKRKSAAKKKKSSPQPKDSFTSELDRLEEELLK